MKSENPSIKPSIIDNVVGLFSPKAKSKRLYYKVAAHVVETHIKERKYEGASKGDRLSGWRTPSTSGNVAAAGAIRSLRDRARDLRRNNAHGDGAVETIAADTVGDGIRVKFSVEDNPEKEKLINDIWKQWSESTACDHSNISELAELQTLVMEGTVESGEVIGRFRRVVPDEGNPLGLEIQLLESDFIDSSRFSQLSNSDNEIINGIEYEKSGKPVNYYLFESHPGGQSPFSLNKFKSNPIPAAEIMHIFKPGRLNTMRGVSWFNSIMIRLRDYDEYQDAQLLRQKIASCFAAFVHDIEGVSDNLSTKEKEEILGEVLEPGIIEHLGPGKTVTFGNPPTVEGIGEYSSVVLRECAVGMHMSYEAFTGDLSQVNFSSAKLGQNKYNRRIKRWQKNIMIAKFLKPVSKEFLKSLLLLGIRTDDVKIRFILPGVQMIDPTKEVPAKLKEIRGGLKPLSDAIEESGNDPEEHFSQYAKDNEKIDSLGLTFDSDPRNTNITGNTQTQEADTQTDGDDDEETSEDA